MKTKNSTVMTVMNVIFWIIFIGLCIQTGAILVSFFVSLFVNLQATKDLYLKLDLFDLYNFNKLYYVQIVSLWIILTGLKAYMAYLVIKVFSHLNLVNPFQQALPALFSQISHIAIGAGILALLAEAQCKWLLKQGIEVGIDWAGGEILFFGGIIYILSIVFKKVTELQTENDLTI